MSKKEIDKYIDPLVFYEEDEKEKKEIVSVRYDNGTVIVESTQVDDSAFELLNQDVFYEVAQILIRIDPETWRPLREKIRASLKSYTLTYEMIQLVEKCAMKKIPFQRMAVEVHWLYEREEEEREQEENAIEILDRILHIVGEENISLYTYEILLDEIKYLHASFDEDERERIILNKLYYYTH